MYKYVRNESLDELSEINQSDRYCIEIQDIDSGDTINYEYTDSESLANQLHNTIINNHETTN